MRIVANHPRVSASVTGVSASTASSMMLALVCGNGKVGAGATRVVQKVRTARGKREAKKAEF